MTFSIKFGCLRVTSLPRRIRNRRLTEGVATDLKADMQIQGLGGYETGAPDARLIPYTTSWSAREQLSWYTEDWRGRLEHGDTALKALEEWGHVLRTPPVLWNYLRNPSLSILPVAEDQGELLVLLFTLKGHNFKFFADYVADFGHTLHPGKWKIKVTIYSKELKPKDSTYYFRLDFRDWDEFKLEAAGA